MRIDRPRDTGRQRTIEKREQKLGGCADTVSGTREWVDCTCRWIDSASELEECPLCRRSGDLSPTGLNPSSESGRESRDDQPAWEMNRRLQKWKGVTDDRSAERGVIPGEFLVVVSGQSFIAAKLEHHLGRGLAEQGARVTVRVELEGSDLAPGGEPHLEPLPAELAVSSFVVDPRANPTVHEHAADFGIEVQSSDRAEVVPLPDSSVRAESFTRVDEQAARNILLYGSIAARTQFDFNQRPLLQAERAIYKGRPGHTIQVIEVVGAAEQCGQCCSPGEGELEIVGVGERALYPEAGRGSTGCTRHAESSPRGLLRPRPSQRAVSG